MQVKSYCLDEFLRFAGEFGEAVGEGVGDVEIHTSLIIFEAQLDHR
jgi:hypothetical protein